MSTSGGTSGGGISSATAHLAGAAIVTLDTVPVALVGAPGANRLLVVEQVFAEFVPVVVTYDTAVSGDIGLFYGAGPFDGTTFAAGRLNGAVGINTPVGAVVAGGIGMSGGLTPARVRSSLGVNKPLVVAASVAVVAVGPIVTATLAAGGTGYVVNDTGTIDVDLYSGGAAYRVTAVAPVTGAVTAFTLTAPGDGYSTFDNPLATTPGGAQPGIGTGLTVNVTAVHAPDGDLYVTAYYRTLTTH